MALFGQVRFGSVELPNIVILTGVETSKELVPMLGTEKPHDFSRAEELRLPNQDVREEFNSRPLHNLGWLDCPRVLVGAERHEADCLRRSLHPLLEPLNGFFRSLRDCSFNQGCLFHFGNNSFLSPVRTLLVLRRIFWQKAQFVLDAPSALLLENKNVQFLLLAALRDATRKTDELLDRILFWLCTFHEVFFAERSIVNHFIGILRAHPARHRFHRVIKVALFKFRLRLLLRRDPFPPS